MLYQAACIYSLTSPGRDDDRREGLRLLAAALRAGFTALDLAEKDSDLAALRQDPEFRLLLQSARRLARVPSPAKHDP
jgi:hypothetical protein